MERHHSDNTHTASNTLRVVGGLLIGGVAGAGVMMLVAPQSGKRTRARLQLKGLELAAQASEGLDTVVEQLKVSALQFVETMSGRAEDLQQRGRDLLAGQKERLALRRGDRNEPVSDWPS